MHAPARGIFLNNEFVVGDRPRIALVDPANGTRFAQVAQASAEDAHAAMDAAAQAQPAWEDVGGHARAKVVLRAAEILRGRKEDLARVMTREMGKVLREARAEVDGAIDNLEYYSAYGRTLAGEEVSLLPRGESLRLAWVPRGVIVAITPWNFPAATVTRKIAPALVGGNTMVLKPSSATPLSSLLIAEVFRKAGLPPAVLQVLPGPGRVMGPALIGHPRCSTVTLTGSTSSGIEVLKLAAPRVAKCLLELGGKAPVIVERDADLDWAARATVWARYWNNGQACIAAERCYVEGRVADAFARKVVRLVRSLRMGPGLARGSDLGPLMSESARTDVASRVETAVERGAKVLVGGTVPRRGPLARGAFYAPTVLDQVEERNPVAREEVFGPVLPLLEFDRFDEVLARANDSEYGLSSYIFTGNAAHAERAARELRFGETYVNRVGPETAQGYHAGFRHSGLGGEGSRWGVQDYLQLKSVYVDWSEPHAADYFLPYRPR